MKHQLFILDKNITITTQSLVDSHIIYSCFTSTSFLSSAISLVLDQANTPQDSSLRDLPCKEMLTKTDPWVKWAAQSPNNLAYLLILFQTLHKEYTFRFGKIHKFSYVVDRIAKNMYHYVYDFVDQQCTVPPLCMSDIYHTYTKSLFYAAISVSDFYGRYLTLCAEAYKRYYLATKTRLFKWTKRDRPQWTFATQLQP
jgi:hypothetical protein